MEKILRAAILVLGLWVFSGTSTLYAQDTLQMQSLYNTRTVSNTPEDMNNLHLAISPIYLDANNLNIAFGYGAELTYLLKNRININARYQRAYMDRAEEDHPDVSPGLAATGSSPSRNFDLGFTYYFRHDTSHAPESIFIERKRLNNSDLSFTVDVPAKRMRLWGARGGFIAFKTFIKDIENKIGFKGYLREDPASQIINFSGAYSTMMESNTFYMGISRLDITNLLVEVEGLGMRGSKRRAELYADVMYAPNIVYYNMSAHGTANSIGFQEYNVSRLTPRSRFGARLGYTRWSVSPLGIGFGAEVGVRPGPAAGVLYNTYINLRASVNLSTRI